MELFFSDNIMNNQIFLDEEQSHHCIRVMRHQSGDQLTVTDGAGKKYSASIISDDRRKCILNIDEVLVSENKKDFTLHIAIAPTKNIDRFEWFLEKATEIGIDEITPIICQRSERNKIKHERLNKILIASMKQSLRLWLPKLNQIISLKEIVIQQSSIVHQKFIAHCQSQNLPSLQSLLQQKKSVLILIGPEGDFSNEEISLAEENNFQPVSLSGSRLRTETAGMVAAQTFQMLNN